MYFKIRFLKGPCQRWFVITEVRYNRVCYNRGPLYVRKSHFCATFLCLFYLIQDFQTAFKWITLAEITFYKSNKVYPSGKNSQNSAHLRIIRTATAMRRRKCELFAIIRICDVESPAQMRIIFRKKIFGFKKKGRVFAVGSPAQMRSIFRRWEKFRIAGANSNYFSQKNFRFRKKRAVFSPSVRRRKCEVFFADEKNFSQLRIIRICVALRRRIAGANSNYFSQKKFRFRKKRAVFSPSVRRRKCELFFADEKNNSQLRIFYFRKWSRNTAEIGLSLLVFELNHFKDLSKILSYFRKIIRICAGDSPSQCDANTNYSQLRKILLICEKYFGKTANFGRICELF